MHFKSIDTRSVISRTLGNIAWGWKRISAVGDASNLVLRPELPDADIKVLRKQMQECLNARGGEVSARSHAAVLGQAYLELNDEGRYRFLKLIADEFGITEDDLAATLKQYLQEPDDSGSLLAQIKDQLTPPWMKLFTQFNALPSGVKFLVDMRADLVRFSREQPGLNSLNNDLQQLLVSWFDIGFLDLKRITWDEPASLLEKLIAYEAVHEIQSWDDLKNRLDTDRCCYAFFHPRMPDEPLIFVQVALVNGMSGNIHELLDDSAPLEDPESVDTAIFYSISNTQLGLRGVSLGDFLIKRVVDDLVGRLPNLRTFATLSPVPGFRQFLENTLESDETPLLKPGERDQLKELTASRESDDAYEIIETRGNLEPVLMRLCSHYLVNEKRELGAADSVENFHLTNGARIEQLNWLGDHSEAGMKRSLGIMVNYRYKLADIEKNHEAYITSGEIKCSSKIRGLLK